MVDPEYSAQPDSLEIPHQGSPSLTPLTPTQAEFCIAWYNLANQKLGPDIQSSLIRPDTQAAFATAIHSIVATEVAAANEYPLRLPADMVETNIAAYFQRFPPHQTPTREQIRQKINYQDFRIDRVRATVALYPEFYPVFALRRACRDQRQKTATRALFGLLTAYGETLSQIRTTRYGSP